MFRRKVKSIQELLPEILRNEGLETPMRQQRLLSSWEEVVGAPIAHHTGKPFIKNQTLFVKVNNPALRADLTMGRSILVRKLNEKAGAQIIFDIKFY